jgi:hypothetical protein
MAKRIICDHCSMPSVFRKPWWVHCVNICVQQFRNYHWKSSVTPAHAGVFISIFITEWAAATTVQKHIFYKIFLFRQFSWRMLYYISMTYPPGKMTQIQVIILFRLSFDSRLSTSWQWHSWPRGPWMELEGLGAWRRGNWEGVLPK